MEKKSKGLKAFVNNYEFTLFLFIVVLVVVFSVTTSSFLNLSNILSLLNTGSITAILAIGMTMVVICGGIDLSAAANLTLCGIICTNFMWKGWGILPSVLVTLLCGMVVGVANGLITAKLSIPDFIATLALQLICHGITFTWTGGYPVYENIPESFLFYGQGRVLGIPVLVIFAVILYVIFYLYLEKTTFGAHLYATGGNKEAARLSGINVDRVKISTFVFTGLLAAIAGILMASRLGSGQPTAGDKCLNDVIGGTILGGTSPSGGVGKIYGTFMGVMIFTIISNGLTHLRVDTYIQEIVRGGVIILALAINTYRMKKAAG